MVAPARVPFYEPPPIPFIREEEKQASKFNSIAMKLRVNPTDQNSPTYEITVPFFSHGTPQEALDARANLLKIFRGQNITLGTNQCSTVRDVLKGDALNAFNKEIGTLGSETVNNCSAALKVMVTNAFPTKALLRQKKAMRRHFRFTADMTIKGYIARFIELNDLLEQFPANFDASQKLNNSELLDVMVSGLPRACQDKLAMEGFDPMDDEAAVDDLRSICERVEETQGRNWQQRQQPTKKQKPHQDQTKKRKKYCEKHGHCAHSTNECRDLAQGDKGVNHQQNKKPRYQNKTWNRQPFQDKSQGEKKAFASRDMNTFIQQTIEKGIPEALQEALGKIQQNPSQSFPKNQEEMDNFNFDKLNVSSDSDADDKEIEI